MLDSPIRTPLLIAATCFVLWMVIWLTTHIEDWSRDFSTNVAQTDSNSLDPLLKPLILPGTVEESGEWLSTTVAHLANWKIITKDKEGESQIVHLERSTDLLRFVDDVKVTLTPEGNGCRVTAISQSRRGKGDLGQNPRNLRQLMSNLACTALTAGPAARSAESQVELAPIDSTDVSPIPDESPLAEQPLIPDSDPDVDSPFPL